MGTIILLAGFLLAASANPIANSGANSIEDASDAHSGDVSSTDDHSQSSNQDNTDDHTGEHETPNDYLAHSVEDNAANGTDEQDISHNNSADNTEDNTPSNTGDEHSSSVSHDSATSTEVSSEVNSNNHADDAATSVNSPHPTESTERGTATNRTEVTTTSSDTTVSTTPTQTENSTQESSGTVPTPADADPSDCRNATQRNHTYLLCSYSCQQDEMFMAPDNSTCYLYPKNLTTELLLTKEYDHVEHNGYQTGVCFGGECVQRSTGAPAATTESSATSNTTVETADTSTQESSDTVPTPADADPSDCRNATQKNHIYLLCSFSCQEDEMFTAPNHSVCYLHPANVTTELTMTEEDNHEQHNANETGVCIDGKCVKWSNGAPAAPTESSPAQNTASETGSGTQSTINNKASVVTAGPNDVSEPSPELSPPEDSPTKSNGSPEKPLIGQGSSEVEEASSTTTNGPVALPGDLPAMP